jgi:hypothetical protein
MRFQSGPVHGRIEVGLREGILCEERFEPLDAHADEGHHDEDAGDERSEAAEQEAAPPEAFTLSSRCVPAATRPGR